MPSIPFMLTTGRQLEHWHTGAMTRRAATLDALEPGAVASLSRGTIARLGIAPGDMMRVIDAARHGSSLPPARTTRSRTASCSSRSPIVEAAANLLTNPALDPFGKIPEFKYCAAKVERVDQAARVAAE